MKPVARQIEIHGIAGIVQVRKCKPNTACQTNCHPPRITSFIEPFESAIPEVPNHTGLCRIPVHIATPDWQPMQVFGRCQTSPSVQKQTPAPASFGLPTGSSVSWSAVENLVSSKMSAFRVMMLVFFARTPEQGQTELRGFQPYQVAEWAMQESEVDECKLNSVQGGGAGRSEIDLV